MSTMGLQLRQPPLIEALVQLKWKLEEVPPHMPLDPAYPLFVGFFYEKVKEHYPFKETLPASQIPDHLTPHVVKYRFRKSKDSWPLVQVGPGIAALNFTENYNWNIFFKSAKDFFPKLLNAYEAGGEIGKPNFSEILLRYINAVEFGYLRNNIIEYLASKLNVDIQLPGEIINSPNRNGIPSSLRLEITVPIKKPLGSVSLLFASGTKHEKPAVVWELNIRSAAENVPQDKDAFRSWITEAHEFAESCFFALINGELTKQFQGA